MAGRPPARRSDRDSWEGDHRRGGYRDEGYPDRGHRDQGSPYRSHRDRDDWDAYYRDDGYRDRAYGGLRDDGNRDGGGTRVGVGYPEDGGRAGQRGSEHRSWDDDRVRWDGRDRWSDTDSRGWGRGARVGRAGGGDRRGWDDDGWDWADEDPGGEYRGSGHRRDTTGGAEGNERLTALTGSVLLVLFAAEGLTILSVHQLLTLHFFLGMLLIGPVALKACSVLYRFVRYYTGAEEYRRKGPPAPLLRLLGPAVMVTSLAVLGTGVMLAVVGPSGMGTWLFLHRASFVLWFGAMTVHVLAYVWRLPGLISGDLATRAGYRAQAVLAGRPARFLLLAASLLTGLLLAMLTVHRVDLWFGIVH